MQQLTEHKIQQKALVKAARTAIRLKHSLEADAEMYRRLPDLERRIDGSVLNGKPFKLSIAQLLDSYGK